MSKVPETIVTTVVTKDTVEHRLAEAATDASGHNSKLSVLASFAYEAVAGGKYGKGPFEITMCAGDDSLAMTVTTIKTRKKG